MILLSLDMMRIIIELFMTIIKMIEYLIENDGMSYEEAVEFIEYNTLRSIPYAGDKAPIILNRIEF